MQAGLQPGQIVKGEVVLVDQNGMLVKLSKNTNAYVANEHMSDLGEKHGKIKYKVGSKVTGRILKVDLAKRRTTMSLQHSLVSSKTKPLSSLEVNNSSPSQTPPPEICAPYRALCRTALLVKTS